MAASYDPDPTQFLGIRLPVTFDTCEIIEDRWANWLRHDPAVAIETQADNLRTVKALYIDCGEKDQFNLLYGARRFVRRLDAFGIAHRYEEFPDNHSGVDYRMDEIAVSRPGAVRLMCMANEEFPPPRWGAQGFLGTIRGVAMTGAMGLG